MLKKFLLFIQALLNPAVPSRLKYEIGICVLYFISPIDFVPDFIPFSGRADDLVVLLWGIKRIYDVIKLHRQHMQAKKAASTP
ncbi:protein of unknown function DUF1232 [Desulfotomaculum nigrificans CO-1-SRB]|uniref:DUF1232 domain-containing protein n=1 Tax=Desulfotomaculum nigrificans (strain DSM 14880 / VKM B-2319 / CO-1-SRB) TaxID=868595 RepID=F6B4A1_DESCC|nr:YkvA family protein [Desulfotomaculum nigrificans]AEF95278.1 protein of unknown function DUF1232 [Desulfotomaculum nigrificans CO-1-SRB]